MSHPPETSLSSWELAERIFNLVAQEKPEVAIALIDAWVQARDTQICEQAAKLASSIPFNYLGMERKQRAYSGHDVTDALNKGRDAIRALATAHKQLEETP